MKLEDYLTGAHRFRWGGDRGNDCMTFCARWVEIAAGIDPIAHLRGTYSDAQGAERLIIRNGGLVALAANVLETKGFMRTDEPRDGDVGIIVAPAGFDADRVAVKEIAAIRWGPLWAALGVGGVIRKQAEMVAAWRICV